MSYPIFEIHRGSPGYPEHLNQIMAPPRTLWAMGNLDLLNTPGVSVVGSRNASETGLIIADRISQYISSQNIPVVSGLALGIDAAAHGGSVKVNGPTIAVLASGVDVITPKSNTQLAQQILSTGGLIVSEHPPGTPARRDQFVPRNRIQVGLSYASVIIESSVKSGTMTHAKFCHDEKHSLYTIAPNNSPKMAMMDFSGARRLMTEMSAIPLHSKSDYQKLIAA